MDRSQIRRESAPAGPVKALRFTDWLVALLLLPTLVTGAERVMEIIPLKHRLVDEVIPVLKPLVEPGGTLTGMNNQLIIKSSPANIEAIREILADIDHAPRQLQISVRQANVHSSRLNEQSVSGRYDGDGVDIESGASQRRRDVTAGVGDRDGNRLEYSLRDRNHSSDKRSIYQVRATEGYPAFIQSGQSIPLPNRNVTVTPGGVVVQEGHEYRDVTSGFYVLPRVSNDRVTLEVAPRVSRMEQDYGPPVVQLQDVQTVIEGRLGEWIPLGGIEQSGSRDDSRLLEQRSVSRDERSNVLIKVEELH